MPVLCLSTTFWTGLLFFIMSLKCCLTVSSIPSLLVFHRWDGKASQMPVTSVVVKELQTETSKEIRSRLNLSLRCSFPVNSPLPTVKQIRDAFEQHKTQCNTLYTTVTWSTQKRVSVRQHVNAAWVTSHAVSSTVKMSGWTCSSQPTAVLPDGPRCITQRRCPIITRSPL